MQVLDDHHARVRAGTGEDELAERLTRVEADKLGRRQTERIGRAAADHEIEQMGQVRIGIEFESIEPLFEFRFDEVRRGIGGNTEPAPHHLDERQEWHAGTLLAADRFQQQHGLIVQRLGELEYEPRLAETCVADHVDGAEAALLDHVPMLAQERELDVAAAQARQAVPALGAKASDARAQRVKPVDLDRLRPALEPPRSEEGGIDEAFNEIESRLGDATEPGSAVACSREATFIVSPSAL